MRRTSYSTLKPNEGIKVWINTTPDTIGGSVLMYIHRDIAADPIEAAAGWYQYSDTIPEDMMENFYIIFQGISEYGSASYIDDVRIRTAPTCDFPTDLTVDQIFGRTADLHWHPTGISNLIEYKKASDNVWTVASTTDSNYTFTDLEPLTAYRARVIAICSDNGQSYPSSSVSFTTKAACQVPTNVTVAALAREATLTWRDTIATAWQVQYINGSGATADTSEIEDVTETTFEGADGIASAFTTSETADGRYKLSLYETCDLAEVEGITGEKRPGKVVPIIPGIDEPALNHAVEGQPHLTIGDTQATRL